MISQAIILCAGLGKRMMPLTSDRPKPLVTVNETPILTHILNHLSAAGVTDIVINGHAHLPVLQSYLRNHPDIRLSAENDILDTGGGIQTAIPLLPRPDAPCYVINGDAFWQETDTLNQLQAQWDATKMDLLLLLQSVTRMTLTTPVGDYAIQSDGKAQRRPERDGTHMFTGIRILNPQIMTRAAQTRFSFLDIMDEYEAKGRLYGFDNPGFWHHLSTPEDVARVERAMA